MNIHGKDIKIFAGNSNRALAEEIAEQIGLPVGVAEVGMFSDGETSVNIGEVVRGSDVYIIQLLIMIDALKRASSGSISVIIPHYGYARQDRKSKARDPISAKVVANLITVAGADRILTMDLHAPQLQGFFDIPVDHLLGGPILAKYFRRRLNVCEEWVVVSPDVGSVGRSRKFAEFLEVPIAIIDKRRPRANVSEIMNIIGDVQGKKTVLIDDIIDTAGTIVNAAHALNDMGATEVYACCTHAVLSGPAIERIQKSPIKELVTLNTITLPEEKRIPKITQISVADIFGEAIERIYGDISISSLFNIIE